jgi:glycosyltransferase involved in cell wall biosynthesis
MKVSILTGCRNAMPFLKDCAQSLLDQSYKNWEWVFVDDASTDGGLDYVQSLKDPRIRCFRHDKKQGCGSSYHKAVKKAEGEVCAVLDADDMLVDKALKTLTTAYDRFPEIGYIYTQHKWCNAEMKAQRKGLSRCPPPNKSFVEMAVRKRAHCFSHWRTFRTQLRDKGEIFRPGLTCAVDKYMGFALEEMAKGGFLPKTLYLYRYHSNNMSSRHGAKSRQIWMALAREFKMNRKKTGRGAHPVRRLDDQ